MAIQQTKTHKHTDIFTLTLDGKGRKKLKTPNEK